MRRFNKLFSFEWNKGNFNKNWIKHKVTNKECEEVFFDRKRKYYKDKLHSDKEQRYILLGLTKKHRLLFISFTKRGSKVRVVSARPMDKKEQRFYYGK